MRISSGPSTWRCGQRQWCRCGGAFRSSDWTFEDALDETSVLRNQVLTIAKALADAKACGECLCGVEIRLVCCAFACLRLCAADAAMQWLREPMVDGP